MLGKFAETLVVDWGLAKSIGRSNVEKPDGTIGADPTLRPESGSAVSTTAGQIIGTAAFTAAGQVRVSQSAAHTIVEANTAGTTGAEMSILLAAVTAATIDALDFVL